MEYQRENFNGVCDFKSRFHLGWQMAENLHEYSELLFCKKGECIATVNGQDIPLKAGQFVWIPPNYIHGYLGDSAEVVCAVFSNDMIPLFFQALAGRHFCVSAMEAEELSEILGRFYELKKEDFLTISGYLNLICAKVIKQATFSRAKQSDGVLYQKVISFLSLHYTEDITLSSVAKKFGYNEKYLSHTLHELTGIHFRQLLTFYRINHAKQLLEREKGKKITSIATESGFSAINTFHRVFKERTGFTPLEYRKNFCK